MTDEELQDKVKSLKVGEPFSYWHYSRISIEFSQCRQNKVYKFYCWAVSHRTGALFYSAVSWKTEAACKKHLLKFLTNRKSVKYKMLSNR
jgi:hypothetical protein